LDAHRAVRARGARARARTPPAGQGDPNARNAAHRLGGGLPPVRGGTAAVSARDGGLRHLLRRYLGAFGPATRADVASWTGLPASLLEPGLAALEPELRRFRDEKGRLLVDLGRAPRPSGATPAPARFLPKWDSTLLAYAPAERERVLPENVRKTVIRANGDVLATFLVEGSVAGVWRLERTRRKATLVVEPFEPLPRGARRELEDEGARLVRFLEPEAPAQAVRIAIAV
jgi:hypothetical protein